MMYIQIIKENEAWNSSVAFYLYFILIFNCERIHLSTKPSQNDNNIHSVSRQSYRILIYFKFYDKKCI